jgi:3-oxoacyl-[acyl-carrier protein] reductase
MSERRCAIVCGAGSGVGRATAVLLARDGFDVVLVARTREKLEETAAMATAPDGVRTLVLPGDLEKPETPAAVVEQTLERFGRIDAIANCAGAAPNMPIEKITERDWRRCIDANLSYVVHVTTAAWGTFQRQRHGVIVNVSSMASVDPFPGFSIYAAAKVGLNMFTRVTASEGQTIGVRAVAIAPGAIETPMLRELFSENVVPPERTLAPGHVGELIRDCITGRREFTSGETIVLPSP